MEIQENKSSRISRMGDTKILAKKYQSPGISLLEECLEKFLSRDGAYCESVSIFISISMKMTLVLLKIVMNRLKKL